MPGNEANLYGIVFRYFADVKTVFGVYLLRDAMRLGRCACLTADVCKYTSICTVYMPSSDVHVINVASIHALF